MSDDRLVFPEPVTLVGGGALERGVLEEVMRIAPRLVAADGAADRLAAWGLIPDAVIGDMDSVEDPRRWRDGRAAFRQLSEQDTTDFEKCLYTTEAPFYVGAGFTGRRLDHTLAALHVMLARPDKTVVLAGEAEVIAMAPAGRELCLGMEKGARVSFFPLLPVRGSASSGLEWPIDGLELAPGHRVGTSNRALGGRIRFGFESPGAVVMLERRYLPALVSALLAGEHAPGQ